MAEKAKGQSIVETFENLEAVIALLEGGTLSLEESFQAYKNGIKLVNECSKKLDKVEKQIIVLGDNHEL